MKLQSLCYFFFILILNFSSFSQSGSNNILWGANSGIAVRNEIIKRRNNIEFKSFSDYTYTKEDDGFNYITNRKVINRSYKMGNEVFVKSVGVLNTDKTIDFTVKRILFGEGAQFCNSQESEFKFKLNFRINIDYNQKKAFVTANFYRFNINPMICISPGNEYRNKVNQYKENFRKRVKSIEQFYENLFTFEVNLNAENELKYVNNRRLFREYFWKKFNNPHTYNKERIYLEMGNYIRKAEDKERLEKQKKIEVEKKKIAEIEQKKQQDKVNLEKNIEEATNYIRYAESALKDEFIIHPQKYFTAMRYLDKIKKYYNYLPDNLRSRYNKAFELASIGKDKIEVFNKFNTNRVIYKKSNAKNIATIFEKLNTDRNLMVDIKLREINKFLANKELKEIKAFKDGFIYSYSSSNSNYKNRKIETFDEEDLKNEMKVSNLKKHIVTNVSFIYGIKKWLITYVDKNAKIDSNYKFEIDSSFRDLNTKIRAYKKLGYSIKSCEINEDMYVTLFEKTGNTNYQVYAYNSYDEVSINIETQKKLYDYYVRKVHLNQKNGTLIVFYEKNSEDILIKDYSSAEAFRKNYGNYIGSYLPIFITPSVDFVINK